MGDPSQNSCEANADSVLKELNKGSAGTDVLQKADYWHWRVYSYTYKLKNKDYGGIVKTLFNYFTRQVYLDLTQLDWSLTEDAISSKPNARQQTWDLVYKIL